MESSINAPLIQRYNPRNADNNIPGGIKRKQLGKAKNMDHLLCKICLQVYWEPFSTLCGHTFCRTCIEKHLVQSARCPLCDTTLDPKKPRIIPNYAVSTLVGKILLNDASEFSTIQKKTKKEKNDGDIILDILSDANLDVSSLDQIADLIEAKRLDMEVSKEFLRNMLLYEFIEKMIEKRLRQAEEVQSQLSRLRADREKVLTYLKKAAQHRKQMPTPLNLMQLTNQQHQQQHNQRLVPDVAAAPPATTAIAPVEIYDSSSVLSGNDLSINAEQSLDDGPSTSASAPKKTPPPVAKPDACTKTTPLKADFQSLLISNRVRDELNKYRKRLFNHMSSLEHAYFGARGDENGVLVGSCANMELEDFTQVIQGMSQYGNMKRLATINYNSQLQSPHSIVSSIEFDRDGEFFAVAGVTRCIKIYDFNLLVDFTGDNPYPVQQLHCNTKISNVSYNPYSKNLLASSDYEGTIQLWDINVGRATRTLREHQRRCWTVQFNNVDPHLMASGSDDTKVKLWNVMQQQSICSIDAKANVCCVNFSPQSKNHLVFGSADHCVHLYDIRNTSKALSLFCGHRKAVSYVKYCNESEVVSASTDGDLRIWNVNSYKCMRTLRGHQNERNFVGLATDGQHVMCGSENNYLHLYYKNISEPLLLFEHNVKMDESIVEPIPYEVYVEKNAHNLNPDPNKPLTDFISAVCWKKNSNVVVAANSQGTTHILQLQ